MPGPDPRFPCVSAASTDPLKVSLVGMVEELCRELDMRRESYPKRVAKGKMPPEESEWQLGVWAAIHADFAADIHFSVRNDERWREMRATAENRLARYRWIDLVEALQREIALRRRYYPQLIAEERLKALPARIQLERVEAVHYRYWVLARRFWPAELDAKRYRGGDLTEAEHEIFRTAYQRHRNQFLSVEDAPRGEYVDDSAEEGRAA